MSTQCKRCDQNRLLYCKSMCKSCYNTEWKKTKVGKVCEKRYTDSKKGKAAALKKTLKYKNSEHGAEVLVEYYKSNEYLKWSKNKCATRRASKLNATPLWADLDKIKEVYLNCPEGYEVDHIVPLKNIKVCGLHTEDNLQYLTKSDNCKKSNKFDGTLDNEGWRCQ